MSPQSITQTGPAQYPQATSSPGAETSGPSTTAAQQSTMPAVNAAPHTYREKLEAGDEHWSWKIAFRVILIVVGLIGIGCAASIVAGARTGSNYVLDYEDADDFNITWTLITFSVTIIWSAICILVLLLRRPPAPVHPGAQVGIDLVLWLAYVATALWATVAVINAMSWGTDGWIGDYSSYGHYTYDSGNGTWVWTASDYATRYGNGRNCDDSMSSFSSCAEQDAYVNSLWKSKPSRVDRLMTATVCQFIGLVLHFALFVWACVDTHRRNRRKTAAAAERLALEIVSKMVDSGTVVRSQDVSYGLAEPQPTVARTARYA
ncbi:hypothetical protein K461DRAFT_281517 [Myriangium duriaei CBS 260.36]|uniref:MARVEL domain-containing protein n=1 Tax=Myriangium duriaei CBS 260.36 TaxID=1168546 RepID=A0A9P4IYN8_9PEZI|nr:hypothetical protein K461DRAFT_281517 [Myriangium duriaei CBS 260.36]